MDKEALSLLKRIGLNQYESRTYLALVGSGPNTATKLSDMAEIPRPRVYDVLSKLLKKGFVAEKPTRPTTYIAMPLNAAMESLKRQKIEEHTKELEELEEMKGRLAKNLEGKTPTVLSEEDVYILKGRKGIYSLLGELIKNANQHIVITSNQKGLARKKREYNSLLKRAESRGIKVTLKESPHRIAIVDNNALVFLSNSKAPKNEEAAWIKSDFVANSFKDLLSKS
ncbi:MAG: TrmB family transcriptional regulator [Candidatus Diapherotrites archaeon]|nr:TrmB family transcriptional regulator [Candidatus Diapherotrites archaeon]